MEPVRLVGLCILVVFVWTDPPSLAAFLIGGVIAGAGADRPPRDIATLEERLRSRFEWGLIDDVQFFEHKERIQEEFFHTLQLVLRGRQADRARLSCRFEGSLGIVIATSKPDVRAGALAADFNAASIAVSPSR
jgi:chromosomal replication initiation ATPase DnaA